MCCSYQHTPDKSPGRYSYQNTGYKAVVDKRRKIYFIGNVKFHFDTVDGLGTFVEVEPSTKTEVSALKTAGAMPSICRCFRITEKIIARFLTVI